MTTPETGSFSPDPSETPGTDVVPRADVAPESDIGKTVAALTADDIEPESRRRLLGRLVDDVRRRGLGKVFRPKAAIRWMADVVGDIAPHVPIRDLDTLHRHFDGLDGDELADRLIRNAARATAGVGAAGGGVASLQWTVTPTLLKLIGELHEVYRMPIEGSGTQRAAVLVQSWAAQRGVNPLLPGVGVGTVLGTTARKELQNTLLRRFGRNLTTMAPLLTGAAVASYLNQRATKKLAESVQKDFRKKAKSLPPRDGKELTG
jgi:hypothetical protein